MKRFGLFIFVAYAVSGGVAHAATYYVSKAGSNGNSCAQAKSVSTPKLTINAGISCLSTGGDTLLIRGGTYDERITHTEFSGTFPSGTSWSNKVRVANYPGETVWMIPSSGTEVVNIQSRASYVEFDGINVDGREAHATGIAIAASINTISQGTGACTSWPTCEASPMAHHIRWQNAEVMGYDAGDSVPGAPPIIVGSHTHAFGDDNSGFEFINLNVHVAGVWAGLGWGWYGIYLGSNNSLVEYCDIYDTRGGVHAYNGDGGDGANNNIIRNNRIHSQRNAKACCPGTFAVLAWGINNQIYNNLIYDIPVIANSAYPGAISISYGPTGSQAEIYNNTFYNIGQGAVGVSVGATVTFKNNIVYQITDGGAVLRGNGAGGVTQSNNLMDGTDPSFVNAPAGNFQLQPWSRAIDSGTGLSNVTIDFTGGSRSEGGRVDIGAFEYRPAQPASAPPAPLGLHIVAN